MKKTYNFLKILLIAIYRVIYWKSKGASLHQIFINLGSYFLSIGAIKQVGQPVTVPAHNGGTKRMYIKNIYYNFAKNNLSATYSVRPIPKFSEPFITKKNEKRG